MLYLLDANVLIDANRDYYPLTRVPEFWKWLAHMGKLGHVKIPTEVVEEIQDGKDALAKWSKLVNVRKVLFLDEEANPADVSRVVEIGYAPDLTDDEIEKIGRDAFLISYALVDPGNRCVVTTEVSKPKRQRANRHVPDVCRDLAVPCCNTFELVRQLHFTTSWSAD